jgi:sterol desaturase/sphingolipid hydroxylase (fatty acid hydroxylase superfamily)
MGDNFFYDVISDTFSFQLSILGITFTLFTVLYSFILNKRDEMILYRDYTLNGNNSPSINQRNTFAKVYINKLKRINLHLLIILLISFLSITLTIILKYNFFNNIMKLLFYINFIITAVTIIYIVILVIYIVFSYLRSTRI